MSDPQVISSEPAIAHPPRFWWAKRIAMFCAVVLLGLAGLRWWWGHVADVQIREVVDAAHARGEPILPEDFASASIPDSENAAVTLQLAASAMFLDPNSDAMDSAWNGGAFTPLEVAHTDAVAANNTKSLQLVRLARSQPRADWRITIASPVPPGLNGQRELAKIQEWVALRDHAKGQDGETLEHVLDMLHQTDALRRGTSSLTMYLTAMGIDDVTISVIERIAPDLKVATSGSAPAGAATASQVRSVIAVLLDDQTVLGGAKRAWEVERAFVLSEAGNFAATRSTYAPIHPGLIAPLFRLDGAREARYLSQETAIFSLPNWPAAAAAMPAQTNSGNRSGLEDFARLFSQMLAGWSAHATRYPFQALTDRRAAAIEFALTLYRADHGGRLPEKLSQLVPSYLPGLPSDPMAADGRTFGYHPAAQPPVIYSIGFDGVDDGGTSVADESKSQFRWRMADAVYPLAPFPPATQPASTQADDHQ